MRSFLHNALLEKVENRPSFFDKYSLDQGIRIYEKVENLFDQCHFAQLEKKATLACVFDNLRKGVSP